MSDFIGPCVHGRDPYERCEDGCSDLEPAQAEVLALRAERDEAMRKLEGGELASALESLDEALAALRLCVEALSGGDWSVAPTSLMARMAEALAAAEKVLK